MKRLLTYLVALAISLTALAATKEHIVERGETLESIAKLYNISSEELIAANPSAKDMIYAGMVLTIPESTRISSQPAASQTPATVEIAEKAIATQSVASPVIANNDIKLFDNWCVVYNARFDDFEHGYYGLGWQFFCGDGLGMTFSIQTNAGIGDTSLLFKFGPIYGYAINEFVAFEAQLRGFVGHYPSPNKKGSKDIKTNGGITLTPKLNFRFGKLIIGVGYEFGWANKYDSLYHDAQFSIGLNI